jgi:predicted TPR repeat methyltransferase
MIMNDYDDFAALYDEATTTDNATKIALFKELIARHAPAARSLLELGCGTGTILQAFETDYDCTGLDISEGMLAVAESKLEHARLVQGSITSFDLGARYDVILCVFNTMNHLLEFAQWEQALERAHAHLAPGGLFIFDANTLKFFADRSANESVSQWIDDVQVISEMTHEGGNQYEWSIAMIDELGAQTQVYIPEVGFPVAQIETVARKQFTSVELTTGTKKPASEAASRVYFVCRS